MPGRRRARRRRRSVEAATRRTSNPRSVSSATPDLHRPQLHELSITHFTLAADGPDYDLADLDAWIKWHDRTNAWHASAPAAVSYWPALTDSGRLRASLNRRVMAALICMFFTAMPSGWVTTVSTSNTPVRVYQYFEIPEMSVAIR